MSDRRLPDDEVDRLLHEALADDLPPELEEELRRETRRVWRRAASEPRPAWWALVPQPALVAAALVMLTAGAVMQAAPAPRGVVESFAGRQAWALAARAMGRARTMECVVEAVDDRGRPLRYTVDWKATGETRLRYEGAAGPMERTVRLPRGGPSVLTGWAVAPDGAPRSPELDPVRAWLSPSALSERLAASWRPPSGRRGATPGTETFLVGPRPDAPGLTVTIDTATHLPLRLERRDRGGGMQAAVCRWP